jgi:hypothetical protein
VTIGDANVKATDTLTITLGGAGGVLTDGTGFSRLATTATPGVYTLSGTAAAITNELDALSFKPKAGIPNTTSTTTFKLSDQSSAYAYATLDSSTSVIDGHSAALAELIASPVGSAEASTTQLHEINLTPAVIAPSTTSNLFHSQILSG